MIKSNLNIRSFLLLMLFSFFDTLALSVKASAQQELIKITNPYIKVVGQNAISAAGYMVIENLGNQDITMIEAASDFAVAMLHTSEEKDGIVRMIHLNEIYIEAGKKIAFQPGGLHIMFVGIKEKLINKNREKISLKFKSSNKSFEKKIEFVIKKK